MATIRSEVVNGVAWLRVDNPERRNAVTLDMWRALPSRLREFEQCGSVRLVVLTGTGDKAFISGADISEFDRVRSTPADVETYEDAVRDAESALRNTALPTIAAVNGICYGGGLGLAANCDLRYAARSARFCMPAARLGLGYGLEGVQAFLNLVGPASLKEIFFTGTPFDAEHAAHIGFVNRIFDDNTFATDVTALSESIASNAPLTLKALKVSIRALQESANVSLKHQALAAIQACFDSDDYKEGRTAFAEKRQPSFRGR